MYDSDRAFARAQREYENRMPPEADEVTMNVTCSMEVERKFVTPLMVELLERLQEGGEPFETAAVRALLREWRFNESVTVTCGFDGETDTLIGQGTMTWTCPACGEEHDDPWEDERP